MIGSEICIVTAVTFNSFVPATWTVTRGAEGTTASTYAIDTPVNFVVTQSSLRNYLQLDRRQMGDISTIPYKPPEKGDFFIPQDSFYTMVAFDGNGWKFLINGRALTPPNLVDWTLEGPSTTTVDITRKAAILINNAPVYSIHAYYRPAPSTPYNLTVAFLPHLVMNSNNTVGIGWRSSATPPQYSLYSTGVSNGNSLIWRWYNWTTYNAYNSDYTNGTALPTMMHGPLAWMRIRDDGTNRLIYHSSNGINWTSVGSVARTNFMTPTYICLHVSDAQVTTTPIGNNIIHMEIT